MNNNKLSSTKSGTTNGNASAKNNNTSISNNTRKFIAASMLEDRTSGTNPVVALIVLIIIAVLLYFAGTYIWSFYKSNQTKVISQPILSGINNGQSQYDVGSSQLPNSSYSNEYSISFWTYVDDYSYRQGLPKFIMRRGSIATAVNPEIYLHPSQNRLQVNISLIPESSASSAATSTTAAAATSTTAAAATTTTAAPTTTPAVVATTTTASATFPPVTPPGALNFTDIKEGFTTCNCDQVRAPEDILKELSENNPKVPNIFNPELFGLISGNEVSDMPNNYGNQPSDPNKVLPMSDGEHFQNVNSNANEHFQNVNPPAAPCSCDDKPVDNMANRGAFEAKVGKCVVEDFPLQKWVHVVVSQYNQVVDIYIDGKLKSSCVLPRFPDIVQDDLVLSPDDGFSGQMSKVEYLNTALTADKVYDLYTQGPYSSTGLLDSIPNWVWVVLAVIVLGSVIYTLV